LIGRIFEHQHPDRTRIVIGPERSIGLMVITLLQVPIFGSPWLIIAFAAFDESARRELVEEIAKARFTALLGLAFTVYALIVFTSVWFLIVLWYLFGRKELTIDHASLTLTWRTGSLSHTRRFQTSDIFNMRYRELVGRKTTTRDIVFECEGRTVSAVSLTSEEEAAALLSGPLSALSFRSRRPELHTP
jgi:hypothetical protein